MSYHLKLRCSCILNPNVSQSLGYSEKSGRSSGLNINNYRDELCFGYAHYMECCKTHLYLFPGHLLEPPGEAFNIVTHCSPSHVPREGLENQRVGRLLRNCFQHGIDLSSTSLSKGRHWNEKNCIKARQTAKKPEEDTGRKL